MKIRKATIAQVKATDDPMTLDIVGSTEEVDRDGDVIRVEGWELKAFRKNPVFMWAHNYTMPPLGKAIQVTKDYDAKRLVFRVNFSDHNPMAKMVAGMYKEGVLNASSVGFFPLVPPKVREKHADMGPQGKEYNGQELLELSAVPIPSNAGALQLAVSKGLATTEELTALSFVTDIDDWLEKQKCPLGDKCPKKPGMSDCPKGDNCALEEEEEDYEHSLDDDIVGKPLPKPGEDESEKEVVSRCMGNETMKNEYPKQDQRLAVCYSQYRRNSVTDYLLKRLFALERELEAMMRGRKKDESLEPGDLSLMGSADDNPLFERILDTAQRAKALTLEPLAEAAKKISAKLKEKKDA